VWRKHNPCLDLFNAITATGYKTLNEGDVVEFDVERGPKGLAPAKVPVVQANAIVAQ
jgi:cold shock CspA family protein